MEWQPIETAPIDGQQVILAAANYAMVRAGQWWPEHQMWSTDFTPTHWMPLPSPPESV